MANSPPRRGVTRGLFWLAMILLLGVAGYLGWLWWKRPDMDRVMAANNRGVGHMEQFAFPEAVQDFEEVGRLAPDWLPGRINLGIAVMNLAKNPKGAPTANEDAFARARAIFRDILRTEPNNPYANFCLGLIIHFRGRADDFPKAVEYFRKVTEFDPLDAAAWYWLGFSYLDDSDREERAKCYRRALDLDPNLTPALQGLHDALQQELKPKEAEAFMERLQALRRADWESPIDTRFYSDLGKYARVIGSGPSVSFAQRVGPVPVFARDENFRVELGEGARWAAVKDFGPGDVAELRAVVRKRFGAVLVALDYDGDGLPDLFLLGAVTEGGQVRDLLLHNEGGGQFRDVTAAAGLGGGRASLGCCVGDFDNDGFPDLLITGAGRLWLFRNDQKGGFTDVSAESGLDKATGVFLGASFVDLDQDGDLDLLVARYADTVEHALAALKGEAGEATGQLAVFLNVGEAPFVNLNADPPPLKPKFQAADPPGFDARSLSAVGVALSDMDLDFDIDALLLADDRRPNLILNDRLLHFHTAELSEKDAPAARWNGALVIDLNRDQRSDLVLIGPGQKPLVLVHTPRGSGTEPAQWFEVSPTNSPALIQAHATDIDLDGWPDVVGLSEDYKPVLLHNQGGRLIHARGTLGSDKDWPGDLIGLLVADFNCDGFPDLLLWSEGDGLQLRMSKGNGYHSLKLDLLGHRRKEPSGSTTRCNRDGFGTRVTAQTATFATSAEYTTLSAGPGQSHLPLILGMGPHPEAELLRLLWPDSCIQAEFNIGTVSHGAPACGSKQIEESNRKTVSCPILFAWDGKRFVFVTDFLGAGSIGECEPDGGHRPPRAEESVKLEPEQMAPLDGHFVMKIAEPMSEITYLDKLQLVVLDHPADVRVYPDERFHAGGPPPTQELIAFREEVFPIKATDHGGRDVTATLARWDRDTVSDFARRSWIGFAEEHAVTLDFGDRLAKFGPKDRLFLCLAGWTDYPFPESIWAAQQAGVEMLPPVLERKTANGKWEKIADAGFPAGLPRLMTLEVTGLLGGPHCELRLRTNLHVFWDQIFVAPVLESVTPGQGRGGVRGTVLEVKDADLSGRGRMKEYSPDGRDPTLYDYDRLDSFPVSRLSGRLTRYGDVTELLRGADDRFVIFGAGDELSVRFDAGKLPPLPEGWKRSYVLRTWGYCKDASPFTAHSETIEPLPFRAMSNYPYRSDEKHPDPEYDKKWNTRPVGPRH
jgi:tetratricopeptide (TPR) repeat protein